VAILGLAFLMGVVSGLRTFTSLAAVAWAARLNWLPTEHTRLAFLANPVTTWIVTALALGELVGDKLPRTPSRTRFLPFVARIVSGSFCGVCLALAGAAHSPHSTPILLLSPLAGAAGSVLGTLGGASCRAVLAQAFGRDFPAAILEDAIAITIAGLSVFLRGRI